MTNTQSNTKVFARIDRGMVQELLSTTAPIAELFHPSLVWVDVTGTSGVGVFWTYDGGRFAPPPPSISHADAR